VKDFKMNKQPTCIAVNSTHADRNIGNLRTLRKVHLLTLLVIASATTLLLLAGCSTPKPGSPEALAVEKEATEKKIDKNLKSMPDWYAKTPLDNNILFASATETSRNMQMSMEKASVKARAELALTVGGRVSTMMRAYADEVGLSNDPEVNQLVSSVTSQEAINVNLSGVQRADAQINREGDSYRAYVLIRYPLGELNKIAVEQVRQNTVLNAKLRASKAFEDLERKVEEAKKRESN
jgi:hypothetical protein